MKKKSVLYMCQDCGITIACTINDHTCFCCDCPSIGDCIMLMSHKQLRGMEANYSLKHHDCQTAMARVRPRGRLGGHAS